MKSELSFSFKALRCVYLHLPPPMTLLEKSKQAKKKKKDMTGKARDFNKFLKEK